MQTSVALGIYLNDKSLSIIYKLINDIQCVHCRCLCLALMPTFSSVQGQHLQRVTATISSAAATDFVTDTSSQKRAPLGLVPWMAVCEHGNNKRESDRVQTWFTGLNAWPRGDEEIKLNIISLCRWKVLAWIQSGGQNRRGHQGSE